MTKVDLVRRKLKVIINNYNHKGMLKDAEDFAEDDRIAKERIDAKSSLESYIYSIKNQMEDEVL
jgi:molecular chaperone DnaK (HSP70)